MEAIRADKLTKRFGAFTAVDGIDFSVTQGEFFGLLGVNGAGKTTTVRMLSCLARPTSGEAFLGGRSILTEREQVKRITDLSPQETAVAPNLTVRENLELMARRYGCDRGKARARAPHSLEEFALGEQEKKRAGKLSGGWQRRLSIAMALITQPEILFLDEPTLGLDVLARRELWKTAEMLKGRVTVILTTHYLEEAEALCDRIAIMVQGRIAACGTAEELKRLAGKDRFEEAFIAIAEGGKKQ